MKGISIALILFLLCPVFCSCEDSEIRTDIDCSQLSSALVSQIWDREDYVEYSDEDVSYLPFFSEAQELSILYSRDSVDVGEVGVILVDSADAEQLKREVEQYLSDELDQKTAFLKNYSPDELIKLQNAEVRRYGGYIVYTILGSADAKAVFEKAEEVLN